MKLLCVVGISTRTGKGMHQTRKPAKATVSLFQKNGESAMQIYTEKTKNGEKASGYSHTIQSSRDHAVY